MNTDETKLADGFLYLLKTEPSLLPPAPESEWGRHINNRCGDAVHSCLRCGKQAHMALIAHTDIGPRWLDLCYTCTSWLRRNATRHYT